jgi:hypothetical protein
LFLQLIGKFDIDAVAQAFAAIGRECLGTLHELVPLLFGQPSLNVSPSDVMVNKAIDEAGIEVVASPDGTDSLSRGHGILLAEAPFSP